MDIGIGRFFSRIKPAISSRDIAGEALLVLIVIELVMIQFSKARLICWVWMILFFNQEHQQVL